ncbi:MAG: hypothetical protein H6Q71_2931 [Firmicutes bacterium]|nr:hypothetical protein [Bacillota bacterium]
MTVKKLSPEELLVVCKNKGIIKWTYPRGTFGVAFRYG